MKKLFLSALAGMAFVPTTLHAAAATEYYINNGVVDYGDMLRVDAKNFVNRGTFTTFSGMLPFNSWNTVNYTNSGTMSGYAGFRFDFSDSSMGPLFFPKAAENFVNVGTVNPSSASIAGYSWLYINAANIVNKGSLDISSSGRMTVFGDNIDLTRGTLTAGNGSLDSEMFEEFWGIGTNRLTAFFAPDMAAGTTMRVMTYDRQFYSTNQVRTVVVMNNLTAYVNKVTPGQNTDTTVDVLIVGEENQGNGINAEGRFASMDGPTTKIVRWEAYTTNRVTGVVTTNTLYLTDRFTSYADPGFITNTIDTAGNYTVHPENYTISPNYFGMEFMQPFDPVPLDPTIFDGTNSPIMALNTTYGVSLSGAPHSLDPNLYGADYTNLPGRIEIIANKVLNMSRTQIQGNSFLRVESTNHFVGSPLSSIISPLATFKLASTNSTMAITNVLSPVVPCINGNIEVWSGRWTNANEMDGTVLYNVTIVHSDLRPSTEPYVHELELKAPNIVISDLLNVLNKSKIDAETLTVTYNDTNAPTEYGQLNLSYNQLVWTDVLPRLRYVTNSGYITTVNAAFFGGARTPPWFSGYFTEPYEAFVNHYYVSSQGNETWARYFESSAIPETGFGAAIDSGVGPLSVRADTAIIKDGYLMAGEDIALAAGSLYLSNNMVQATRAITFDVSGYLSDGSLEAGSAGVLVQNDLTAGGGINLMRLPGRASLLGTTVNLTAYANAEVVNRWAAADRGCSASGFDNNAAIGKLVLDGGTGSVFTFIGVTGNNALYVNELELMNFASQWDYTGNALGGVDIKPGMKIYFAKASTVAEDGTLTDISESLNGKNNGLFCWVGGFTGTAPYVEVSNPDGGTGSNPGDNSGDNNTPEPALVYPNFLDASAAQTTVGTYQGLVYNAAQVQIAQSGFIKVSVNNRGAYSGTVKLAGKSYPISGKLDSSTHSATISIGEFSGSFTVAENDQFGKLTGALGEAQIYADRISPKGKSLYAGRYTFTIPSGQGYGAGYGTILVTPASTLVLNATLGDGTRIKQTLALTADGVAPIYASLNDRKGLVLSWLELLDTGALQGDLLWAKDDTAAPIETEIQGFKYSAKGVNKRALTLTDTQSGGAGQLNFLVNESGTPQPVVDPKFFVLGKNNTVKIAKDSKFTLQILGETGLFQGTFRVDGSDTPVKFKGALRQDEDAGYGLFIYDGKAGEVQLVETASQP